MAHFAEIDGNNKVIRVLAVPDTEQHRGQQFLADDLRLGGAWVQTSYNNNFRKQFAGIGYSYDPVADVFVEPQPFPSWVLDVDHNWQAPVPKPSQASLPAGKSVWDWDEAALAWVAV